MLKLLALLFPISSACSFADATEGCKSFAQWTIYLDREDSPILEEEHCGSQRKWVLRSHTGVLVDQMTVPELPKGSEVNYGDCRINGVLRRDLIAIVKHSPRMEWSRKVRRVWMVSAQQKIMEASTAGVECRNEGYGVD